MAFFTHAIRKLMVAGLCWVVEVVPSWQLHLVRVVALLALVVNVLAYQQMEVQVHVLAHLKRQKCNKCMEIRLINVVCTSEGGRSAAKGPCRLIFLQN